MISSLPWVSATWWLPGDRLHFGPRPAVAALLLPGHHRLRRRHCGAEGSLARHGSTPRLRPPGAGGQPGQRTGSRQLRAPQGAEAVRTWLNSAQPFREYQIDRIISQHDVETREGKLAASTELVTLLAQLTSAVERDEYLRYAASVWVYGRNPWRPRSIRSWG